MRIRQLDCSCTVITFHYQSEGTLHELRRRLRAAAALWPTYPIMWVSSLVTSTFVTQPRVGSNLVTRPSAMVMLAALPPSSPLFSRSVEIAQPFFITLTDVRRDGCIHTFSRLDGVFVNLPMAELRDFQCHSHTVGTMGDKSVPSEHFSVWLVIESPSQEANWITRLSGDGLRSSLCSPLVWAMNIAT